MLSVRSYQVMDRHLHRICAFNQEIICLCAHAQAQDGRCAVGVAQQDVCESAKWPHKWWIKSVTSLLFSAQPPQPHQHVLEAGVAAQMEGEKEHRARQTPWGVGTH